MKGIFSSWRFIISCSQFIDKLKKNKKKRSIRYMDQYLYQEIKQKQIWRLTRLPNGAILF